MAAIYRAYNGATPTTAAMAKVATGITLKTLLQLQSKTGIDLKPKAWGISLDASAAGVPGQIELIETDVAATVTAFATADIVKISNPGGPAADSGLITLGTGGSGFTASSEGTTTVARLLDYQLVAPTNQFIFQWPLGNEAIYQAGKFLRVRVTFAVTVNAITWIDFEG